MLARQLGLIALASLSIGCTKSQFLKEIFEKSEGPKPSAVITVNGKTSIIFPTDREASTNCYANTGTAGERTISFQVQNSISGLAFKIPLFHLTQTEYQLPRNGQFNDSLVTLWHAQGETYSSYSTSPATDFACRVNVSISANLASATFSCENLKRFGGVGSESEALKFTGTGEFSCIVNNIDGLRASATPTPTPTSSLPASSGNESGSTTASPTPSPSVVSGGMPPPEVIPTLHGDPIDIFQPEDTPPPEQSSTPPEVEAEANPAATP